MFENLKRRISNENMKFKLAKRSVKLWAYRPPFHITVFHFWKLFKQCMQATWTIWISNRSKGSCEIIGFYITVQFFWKPFKLFPLLFGLGEIRTNKEQSLIYIRYISLYIDDHNYVQIFTLYFQNIFLFQNTCFSCASSSAAWVSHSGCRVSKWPSFKASRLVFYQLQRVKIRFIMWTNYHQKSLRFVWKQNRSISEKKRFELLPQSWPLMSSNVKSKTHFDQLNWVNCQIIWHAMFWPPKKITASKLLIHS